MLIFIKKSKNNLNTDKSLTLPWEKRIKSRLRVVLDDGSDAGIQLPRGSVLRGGDLLATEDGESVRIHAAAEHVSTVVTKDSHLLTRICYHLGNRHVSLEIGEGKASYLHDHVLDDMVTQLGGEIQHLHLPFEPEHGAYTGHGHSHD